MASEPDLTPPVMAVILAVEAVVTASIRFLHYFFRVPNRRRWLSSICCLSLLSSSSLFVVVVVLVTPLNQQLWIKHTEHSLLLFNVGLPFFDEAELLYHLLEGLVLIQTQRIYCFFVGIFGVLLIFLCIWCVIPKGDILTASQILLLIQFIGCGGFAFGYYYIFLKSRFQDREVLQTRRERGALQTSRRKGRLFLIGSSVGWGMISILTGMPLVVGLLEPRLALIVTPIGFVLLALFATRNAWTLIRIRRNGL